MSKKYWVKETTLDTRQFEIESNHDLDSHILESTYWHGVGMYDEKADAEDITEEVIEEMKRMDYKTIPSDLKVTVKFTGTEYGDDSQTYSGEFAARKEQE